MTRIVIDIAVLAHALKRAGAVAPARTGEAFDKAAGIIFDIQEKVVVIKATDLVTQFATWVTPREISGEPMRWRISSNLLPDVIGKLKTIRNPQVILEDRDRQLDMTHGTMRAAFGRMNPKGYPDWVPFSPDDMHSIEGLADAAEKMQTVASKTSDPPWSGIHFDGQECVATDRYRVVCVPMTLQTPHPITVPAGVLETVLSRGASVLYRVEGKRLHLMPDRQTQISTMLYGMEYPPVQKVMRRVYPQMVKIDRARLLEMMDIAGTMAVGDKNPVMRLFLGVEKAAVMMQNSSNSHLGDVLEIPGQAAHPRVEWKFNPDYLMGAVKSALSAEIVLGYDPDNPRAPLYVDGDGIETWVMPLNPQAVAAAQGA